MENTSPHRHRKQLSDLHILPLPLRSPATYDNGSVVATPFSGRQRFPVTRSTYVRSYLLVSLFLFVFFHSSDVAVATHDNDVDDLLNSLSASPKRGLVILTLFLSITLRGRVHCASLLSPLILGRWSLNQTALPVTPRRESTRPMRR